MRAFLKNYRQSPRKVRLLAPLVKGKSVSEALTILKFADKKAAGPVSKVIESARANAVSEGKKAERLVIQSIVVDKGTVIKRMMPRARGASSPINRRNSHVTVTLTEK